ncbi:acetyl-CoA carboxylase, biotin carboxylase subunit [Chitinophaga sp. CF118]|uniref:acetyl-CoA carboxylase biotin carboxylase subunit n=1 Tax=Chitinophaga sp. CF118 TaxID=1884367 RepID=UPI0008EE50AA|nr:acetyl-CoA carboxylase biotin carboxylase subunit [Chitinophaga sp. CF118]SFE79115.1 acetyl-CoA carboxylase, biotin carboxylase subunit [Chitinophaga sp. CF118]
MKKILVANRGEIALRIMRSAREMGIKTVAVYSEADRTMPFVQYADEAICIGPPPSSQSYLLGDKIIAAARQTGADAIHPGYGFLSENARFAQAVTEAGFTFIGPSAASIDMMGSKLAAKQAAQKFGVPMVPGTETPLRSLEEATEVVKTTGFPILIKASAGGGGKGMRVVNVLEELGEQIRLAKSEAMSAFGDDAVFIEKYVTAPRHIEIQILGDQHGNYVYLFERECSIQRRHQKLIEEAPSSCLTPEIRAAMGKCALDVARACKYYGAGTVEFLVDEQLQFYFLEMNTRLQVEHPVTEMITGLDLVKEQIRVARGEQLSFNQQSLSINGSAIELRICAEDPANNFLPDTGTLTTYIRPQGYGIRVDDGYESGMDIPIYYDPMISKLIAWGATREEARERLLRAIDEYQIKGIRTTLPFGRWALQQPAFITGKFDTNFIGKYFTPEALQQPVPDEARAAALLAVEIWQKEQRKARQVPVNQQPEKWKTRKMLR